MYFDRLKNKNIDINNKYIFFITLINVFKKSIEKICLLIAILLFSFFIYANKNISNARMRAFMQNDVDPQVRIFCLILTSPKYFDSRATAVNQTWAPRCDKYTFISEYSNDTKGLPITMLENLTIGRDHLTQKTTLALKYVYEKFINDFDWFVKADDDTYMFVENLKSFLKDQNTSLPITFGYNFKVSVLKIFFYMTIGWGGTLTLFYFDKVSQLYFTG
jgi:hypothetical protein